MRKLALSIAGAAVALALAAPAVAEPRSSPVRAHQRSSLASTLELRLRSIELQIDMLSDRDLIGRQEAQELRQQSRRLEQRLRGLSRRDAHDLEVAVDRLQAHLRLAAGSARLGAYASSRRDLGRFDDGDRYQRDRDIYYDRDVFRDPRGDPFAIWEERDDREGR